MAIPRRLPLPFDQVFKHGAFLVSDVMEVRDYDKSTKDHPIQKVDDETGLRVWSVDLLDADPEANRQQRTVSVKLFAAVQPVPPPRADDMPFTPVRLLDLEATPYVDTNSPRPRLAWSLRASGFEIARKAA